MLRAPGKVRYCMQLGGGKGMEAQTSSYWGTIGDPLVSALRVHYYLQYSVLVKDKWAGGYLVGQHECLLLVATRDLVFT